MVSKRIIHAQPNPNSMDTQTVIAEPESGAQYWHIYIPYLHMPLAYLCTFTQLPICAWDNNLRGNSPRCWSFRRISYWLSRIVSYDYSRVGLCNGRPDTSKRCQRNRYVLTRWENSLWMYGWCTSCCSKSRAQALCILLVLLLNLPSLRRHDTEAPTTKISRGPSCGNIWSFDQWSAYRDGLSSGILALPPAPGTGQHGAHPPLEKVMKELEEKGTAREHRSWTLELEGVDMRYQRVERGRTGISSSLLRLGDWFSRSISWFCNGFYFS